jgi:hypothetical protein
MAHPVRAACAPVTTAFVCILSASRGVLGCTVRGCCCRRRLGARRRIEGYLPCELQLLSTVHWPGR